MTNITRYAIYLAPKPNSPLWVFGSKVLGYDAAKGQDLLGFAPPSVTEDQWRTSTQRARTYGFHATLKAPFRLKDHFQEHDLISGLLGFARKQTPLNVVPLNLEVLDLTKSGGFLALVPERPNANLNALEAATVETMDTFRAPLTETEWKKRNPASLSARQKHYLERYGYPFVMEEYQAHFTLSDRIANAPAIALELAGLIEDEIGMPTITIDELVLFKQAGLNTRFSIIARVPLLGLL